MKFGFIGAGNMVSAIVKGMTANGYDGKNIEAEYVNTAVFCVSKAFAQYKNEYRGGQPAKQIKQSRNGENPP